MKQIIKKIISGILNGIMALIPGKTRKASFLGWISRILEDSNNQVEYDADYDMYWLKNREQYLYLVQRPYFNFSKKKLYRSIERIACQYYTPKKGDVIVDIGAGIGTETLFFDEKTENEGRIYSIEASRASHQKLVELCAKNQIKTSENLNLAITDSNQKLWIEESNNYQVDYINKESKGVEVDGITLDHFVEEKNITNIDFLKVNIEGSELQMIEGMENAIKITKNVAISCHDFLFDDDRQIKIKMSKFLEANNFQVSYNQTGHQIIDSWIYGKQL
ncbi:FkbM family methyltransferase [Aquimarina sp. EL_43]|uniref:FkbM family methyltransferase n=1 Tax=Aquimarina TaxID=290174 RepID=UPI0004706454|nr:MULTISPECIES: FkbM family methyltransferase [Aquimarina]MBG6128698.1 FkbM family methyltransferase [Aquimarina sp. EL_35]MBG6149761.1 FkbM family methyltransferase [Aquimarina sp. EL_32]MBG6167553.1 FkbM family methyltransferase [Aquimarina sp. EL_43]